MPIKKNVREAIFARLAAVALLFSSICLLASELLPSLHNFGELVIAMMMLMLLVFAMPKIELYRSILFFNMAILFLMGISFVWYDLHSDIQSLLINYFCWGIGVTIILMQVHSSQMVMDTTLVIASITIAVNLFTKNASNYYGAMVWTYAIFPCIAVVITHFVFMRKHGWGLLWYLPVVFIVIRFVDLANRGGFVSMAWLLYFLLIKRLTKTKKLKNRPILNIFLLVVVFVAIFSYDRLIIWIYEWTESMGYQIHAVKKMYLSLLADNVMNNRLELYSAAWEGFSQSPVIGNGIGAFSVHHGGWVHNFVLQLLYEGGVVLFAMVMVPLVYIVYYFVTKKDITPSEYTLFVVLFVTSVPRLLFSSELWNAQSFWMMMTFGMITIRRHRKAGKERPA